MMDISDPGHGRLKRDMEEIAEGKDSRVEEDEEWNGSDKRKRKSGNKSKHQRSEEEERETGKRKSFGEKEDVKKKSVVSSRADSGDEEDYDVKRGSRSKTSKKSSEDKKSGDGYRERDHESSRKVKGEESERSSSRKTSVKTSGHESSQSRSKSKGDIYQESDLDRVQTKDSKHSEKKESHKEKGHSSRRKLDEADSKLGKTSEPDKRGSPRERTESRNEVMDSVSDRNDRADIGDDKRFDGDRQARKNRDRSVEDMEPVSHKSASRSHSEKSERHKQQRDVDVREKSGKEKSVRESKESRHSRKSRSPDRKHYKDSDDADRGLSDSDNEKSRGRDGHRDTRSSKGKDAYKDDRSRDRDISKEHGRRSHSSHKDRDTEYDYDRDYDAAKYHSRSSHRKETRGRSEAAKASSGFGSANDHSDTIEIRPSKSLDFRREGSVSNHSGRRSEGVLPSELPSGMSEDSSLGQGDDAQERYADDGSLDTQGSKGRGQKGTINASQLPFGSNQGSNSLNRSALQGTKLGRPMRGGRGRMPGRDGPRSGMQLPMLGSPFGHLGLPPGAMPPMGPNMSSSTGPGIGPGVFLPGFPPVVWPGVPPALSPLPPGPSGPRFPPGMPAGPNHSLFFNQPGAGRGIPLNAPCPDFSAIGTMNRGLPNDKASGWNPSRLSGPPGKAPSRGEQNDYSQNFVDTGMRPQNFIRELELTSVVEDYPKLRELIQKKDEIVAKSATTPVYYKCDLREFVLSPEFFGTKFDVILVDPPWEEYVHRAPGVADHMESWTFEEIQNLKIETIADTPSFIFLWVGDGVGLEQGRQCLKKWGFRRCEDICWVKTNKTNAAPSLRHDSHTLFQHSKEHCLMGIKGTVRRSTDGHIIHANIDTDVIIAEEPPYGSTTKPEDLYRIIEHFSLGRRRLELFGEDHNIRAGWVTLGKDLSSSNFNKEAYCKNFADKDGKVWQGGGGRNPPLDAPHLVVTTPDIENLRPKSPPQKNQQQQPASLPAMVSSVKRTMVNSPQNPSSVSSVLILNPEPTLNPTPPGLPPWTVPPVGVNLKPAEGGSSNNLVGGPPDEKFFDTYPPIFNAPPLLPPGDTPDFDQLPPVNL
ncbi:methyltransferase MT-A70 family protein [Wolffia australiana]